MADERATSELAPRGPEREFWALTQGLEYVRGFALYLVECDSDDVRRQVTERLRAILDEHGAAVVEVDLRERLDVLDALREACPQEQERTVLVAFGLERQDAEMRPRTLLGMNLQRERYRDELGCPVVLWLYRETLAEMATRAPDFYDWRSGLYDFPPLDLEPVRAVEAQRTLAAYATGQEPLPRPEAQRRLDGISDLVTDLRHAPPTPQNLQGLFRTAERVVNLYRNLGRWQDAIELAADMLERAREAEDTESEASFLNSLGVAYCELPTGDRAENLARAIGCYEEALRVYTEAAFPRAWAMIQNNVGNAYATLSTGDRGENLARAIACYEAALRVHTEEALPLAWATIQNNLGRAYAELPAGDRGKNLARAIECYEAALQVCTEEAFPVAWAKTHHSLGIAYGNLLTGDRAQHLARAIDCYEAALRVYTEEAFPQDWATTQINLGNAYSDIPTGDKAENLARAIGCYEAALRVLTEEAFPQDWAATQINLGNACSDIPTGDKAENLARAIDCYEAALRVLTEEAYPAEWAGTRHNMGLALMDEAMPGNRTENLREAVRCFEDALKVWSKEGAPQHHAHAVSSLAAARAALGEE